MLESDKGPAFSESNFWKDFMLVCLESEGLWQRRWHSQLDLILENQGALTSGIRLTWPNLGNYFQNSYGTAIIMWIHERTWRFESCLGCGHGSATIQKSPTRCRTRCEPASGTPHIAGHHHALSHTPKHTYGERSPPVWPRILPIATISVMQAKARPRAWASCCLRVAITPKLI